jgi:hypothetical protein
MLEHKEEPFHLDPIISDHEKEPAPGACVVGGWEGPLPLVGALFLPRRDFRVPPRDFLPVSPAGTSTHIRVMSCSAGLWHHVLARVGFQGRAEADGGRGAGDGGRADDGRGGGAIQGLARRDALLLEKKPHHVGMTLHHRKRCIN